MTGRVTESNWQGSPVVLVFPCELLDRNTILNRVIVQVASSVHLIVVIDCDPNTVLPHQPENAELRKIGE